jgi:hypothetical protein
MAELDVQRLSSADAHFSVALDRLTHWDVSESGAVTRIARDIIAAVRERGDQALLEYTIGSIVRALLISKSTPRNSPRAPLRCPRSNVMHWRRPRSAFARSTKHNSMTDSKSPTRSAIASGIA